MIKKTVLFLFIFLMLISPSVLAENLKIQYDGKTVEYTDKPMTVTVNNKSIDMPLCPIVFNGRALVPIREVFEAINANVEYTDNGNKKDIILSNANTKIVISINSNEAYINGKKTSIPDGLTPKLINKIGESAKTMVPIRFLSETLGMKVDYSDSTRNIYVYTSDYIPSFTDKLVVIDAGHGGTDSGALGNIDGTQIKEKDINFSIATKVKAFLEEKGVTVQMTRSDDSLPSLDERAQFANSHNASIFVSIHANANDKPEPYGIETYYCLSNNSGSTGITSSQLAETIQKNIISATNGKDRGVKDARFYVIRETTMPAVLIETGFVTNSDEVKLLCDEEYQQKIASAIADGIISNLGNIIK